jgi:hypothetical protein
MEQGAKPEQWLAMWGSHYPVAEKEPQEREE